MFFKVRPEDIFPDVVGENFRVRTCTGSVFSGVVVDFYMEYCLDRILPISVGSLLGKIALSSLCPMVCPVVRLFARVGSTRGAFYGSISGRQVKSSQCPKVLKGGCERCFRVSGEERPKIVSCTVRNPVLGCFPRCETRFARCERLFWDSQPNDPKSLLAPSLKHFWAFWLFRHLYHGPRNYYVNNSQGNNS